MRVLERTGASANGAPVSATLKRSTARWSLHDMDLRGELQQLVEVHREGLLSDAELAEAKAAAMAGDMATSTKRRD